LSDDWFYTYVYGDPSLVAEANRLGDVFRLDFTRLYDANPDEALALLENPEQKLQEYGSVVGKRVEVVNLPESTSIRGVGTELANRLIQVEALAASTSIPESQLVEAVWVCQSCGEKAVVKQEVFNVVKPAQCPLCGARARWSICTEESTYQDVQTLVLQERPDELPPGEVPEPLTCFLRGPLVRTVSPGDSVRVVGVVRLRQTGRRSVYFQPYLEVNSVEVRNKDYSKEEFTEGEAERFQRLASQPGWMTRLVESFAPSIYGWSHIKEALLLALAGGVRRERHGLYRRGDIHILLVGDPGTAKTNLLLFAAKASPRGVYSSGGGVSGAGLTAALVKDGDGRFVLAAGTMALADMGLAALDELDKMKGDDREKIHPAMEQQIVPIDKGGLHTTLNSRCSVVAACNPVEGRYNQYKTVAENVKGFPPSLLSRFDLIFPMLDESDAEGDEAMVDAILGLTQTAGDPLPLEELRRFISYAKTVEPVIPVEVKRVLKEYYLSKRRGESTSGIQVTPRQLEALERLVEASARLHLRGEATRGDADRAVRLLTLSLDGAWRDSYTGEVDISESLGLVKGSIRKQAQAVPRVVEAMIAEGVCHVDVSGKQYVERRVLVDRLVEAGLGRERAQEVVEAAVRMEYVWSPRWDRVMLMG